MKRYKYKLKEILKERRKIRNRVDFNLEDKICSLLQTYHIKRESWVDGTKLNGVNYRWLIGQNEEIIKNIRDIFIEMNKGTVSEDNINMYCDKNNQFFTKPDHVYRCMRILKITDGLISKTKDHVYS